MNKKISILVVLIIVTIITIMLMVSLLRNRLAYNQQDEMNLWFKENSSNGMYHIVVYKVGEPMLFSSQKISVSFFARNSEGTFIDDTNRVRFYTDIANDGATLYSSNYSIEWLDDSVKIIFKGQEQSDAVYLIPYKN